MCFPLPASPLHLSSVIQSSRIQSEAALDNITVEIKQNLNNFSSKMRFKFFHCNLNPIRKAYVSRISLQASNGFYPVLGALSSQSNDHALVYFENPNFRIWKRWHLGHSHDHGHQDLRYGKEGEKIFRLGLAADICLATGKALTGYLSGSTAIIADAAHSVSDVVLSGVALLSFKAARVPKDKEHPYGHGKFETLGALGISGMLLATGGGIAWHAIDVLAGLWTAAPEMINQLAHEHINGHHHEGHNHGIDMDHPILALSMTIVSISVKEGLYWITKRAAERVGSGLMKANAWHHRADAVSSIVALIGVGGSMLGLRFVDPLAGLVVSGMIIKAGLETGHQSVLELVDAAIPTQHMEPYRQTILRVEGVKGCNHLRARRAGSFLYLDVNVEVDPFSSVSAGHDIGVNVRREIQQSHPEIAEVFVHIEPSTSHIQSIGGETERERNAEMTGYENATVSLEGIDIEDAVSDILSSEFSEKMNIERITRHLLQGQILLQIEVSMPPNILISDATEIANEAEKRILQVVPDNVNVSMQLLLGRAMPRLNSGIGSKP